MATQGTLPHKLASGEVPDGHDATLNTNKITRVVVVRPPHHIEARGFRSLAVDGNGTVLATTHALVIEDVVGRTRNSNSLVGIIYGGGDPNL